MTATRQRRRVVLTAVRDASGVFVVPSAPGTFAAPRKFPVARPVRQRRAVRAHRTRYAVAAGVVAAAGAGGIGWAAWQAYVWARAHAPLIIGSLALLAVVVGLLTRRRRRHCPPCPGV